jgi:hypothetical protein
MKKEVDVVAHAYILSIWRLRQEDQDFEASLFYIVNETLFPKKRANI